MWRKLRGLLGIGVTWGALWGMLGAVIGVAVGWVFPDAWTLANPIVEWAIGMGLYGFVSGVGFGGLLTLGEGSKRLRELSLPRVALWGVLGSAAVPILFGLLGTFDATTTLADVIGAVLVTGFLGGIFAPGAIMIARRAELARPEEMDLLE